MTGDEMRLRRLEEREMAEIIAQLDAEFVFAKGRAVSLSRRFPAVMSEREPGGLWGGDIGGRVCAAVAIKSREYWDAGKVWSVGLVGWVWVDPGSRGKGIGRSLIMRVNEHLRRNGLDVGVLWTGLPSLYGKCGWSGADLGVVAEVLPCETAGELGEVSCHRLSDADAANIETLRNTGKTGRLVRTKADYRTIPIPAAEVQCYYALQGTRVSGYALAGWKDNTAYVYELLGEPYACQALYTTIERRAKGLFVNSTQDHPLTRWLSETRSAGWTAQDKAMWLPLAPGLEMEKIRRWHVGYFDWI